MTRLDVTQQRIVGVLIEKERTVPDTYPLTENALLAGCNQSSNRDPEMSLQSFELHGALVSLQEQGWIARVDGSSRVTKYRHKVVERLGLTDAELAVLAELLLRGPQAPGALKPRVARMGFVGEAADVQRVLQQLAARPEPVVEVLPRQPRERDARWQHRLGARPTTAKPAITGAAGTSPTAPATASFAPRPAAPPAASAAPAGSALSAGPAGGDLAARVAALEQRVAELAVELRELSVLLRDGGD